MKSLSFRLIAVSLVAVMFSSCYKEIVTTTMVEESPESFWMNEFDSDNLNGQFVFQNDHIKLTYNLSSEAHSNYIEVKLENLTNRPIYLDVAKSTAIVNKKALNYLKTLDSKERFYYIPSYSELALRSFETGIPSVLSGIYKTYKDDRIRYTKDDSQVKIRSQFTYGFEENLENTVMVENYIWLKEVARLEKVEAKALAEKSKPNICLHRVNAVTRTKTNVEYKYSPGRTFGLVFPLVMGIAALTGIAIILIK